ncbi:LCP family protein [Cellulomonas sp. zg-ZUI22]|uniref:LCP family protein n=1 Tax=Cellulomonas sp. zg-ZUI22 TaxID=2816955 RepID=UPI001A94C0B0|nr:LCP family protein [Cellulomonas sp. zg-ZUI22]MBO0901207.1 LCP family protein [Cellulomonas sp. zg-ZUI22]
MRRLRALMAVVVSLGLVACTGPAPEPTTPAPTVAARSTPAPTPTPTPTPSPTPADPLPAGPLNVLLIGTDSRDPASLGGNADTVLLVHLPADRAQVYLISFTRDMWVPIPGVGEGKLNAAFARGGTPTLVETVSGLLGGAPIDATVQTNFAGFIALTRALGGFEVDNRHHSTVTVQSTGRVVDFPEGRITLSGTDGLIYVRERKRLPLGDLDRTERQRAALVGMLARVGELADDPVALATLLPHVVGNVKVTGVLEAQDVAGLVPLARTFGRDDVVGLMAPITGFGSRGGASVNVVDDARMAELGAAVRADDVGGYVARHGTDYAP